MHKLHSREEHGGMTEESAFCSSGKDLTLNLWNGSVQGVIDDRAVVFKKILEWYSYQQQNVQ